MARNQEVINLTAGTWTQLTNGDVTNITFQVLSGGAYIRFTTDETTPAEIDGLVLNAPTVVLNIAISELTNLSGADRVWAKPTGAESTSVLVDHA